MPEPGASAPHGGFARLKQRALARGIPLTAHLELTYRCNWRCVFCYNRRRFDLQPLSRDEWKSVLDELRALGTLNVVLSGGEPLAHPDFFEIAAAVRERAFALKVLTNGTLVNETAARKLAALRPTSVEMSLHGASAATHDRTTGRDGSYVAMWRGVERLERLGVPLTLKTPLTSLNEHELDRIVDLAAKRGLRSRIDPNLSPLDDLDRAPLQHAPSRRGVEALMALLAKKGKLPSTERTDGGFNCGLGRLALAIDPEGNVFPCVQWRQTSLGNVRSAPLRELWHHSRARQEAAAVAREANAVIRRLGGAAARFPYCPALAQMHTGDPLRPHRAFLELAEAARAASKARGA